MINIFKCAGLLLLLSVSGVHAEVCPTPEEIRDRKISKQYDWSVEETTSLGELLAVKQLYSVRIIGNGEYISCRYTTDKWPVRLDGLPVAGKCKVIQEAGAWTSTVTGEMVCSEQQVERCGYKLECAVPSESE
jgi:hypothetical protein